MLSKLTLSVDVDSLVKQVSELNFGKSLSINYTTGKLLNGPYLTKPEFLNTPLGNILQSIENVGEARLLKLESGESYTAHSDPDDRIHVPIITNLYSYIMDLDNNKMYHLPADGSVWYMDTSVTHVAANFGGRTRIHLNIRVLLPKFKSPGYKLTVTGGDYDWKQEAYFTLMTFFNKSIKERIITGFEKVNEREVLLNCDPIVLNPYIKKLEDKGFSISLSAT